MSSTQEPTCQLNTTECILQAAISILTELQDNNKQYNWDPLSFGVTLVIGIIALFFAALTIGQGLLAAGPGRHKSSHYALGSWADLSTRQFDFRELRFRTLAYTPILSRARTEGDFWPDMESKADQNVSLALARDICDPKDKSKDIKEYFPATWLALLTLTLTDDPKLWDQKAIGTDYMPSDLPAAPAYATVIDLMVFSCLAAFPDTPNVLKQTESGIPSVQCQEFQLVFRTHPLLGTFGLFQTYNPREKPAVKHRSEMLRRLKLSFYYASGYIPRRCADWKPSPLSFPSMLLNRLGNSQGSDQGHAMDLINCWGCDGVGGEFCASSSLLSPCWCQVSKNEGHYNLLWILEMSPATILSAAYCDFPPIVFPTRAYSIRDKVMPLLCLSRLLSLNKSEWRLFASRDTIPSNQPSIWQFLDYDTRCYEANSTKKCELPSRNFETNVGEAWSPYEAFEAYCAGPEEWAKICSNWINPTFLRGNIIKEIGCIDQWLDANIPADVFRCRAASLGMSSGWCRRILALCANTNESHIPLQFVTQKVYYQVKALLGRLGYLTGALNRERSYMDNERQEDEKLLKRGDGETWRPLTSEFECARDELSKIYQLWEWENSKGEVRFKFPRSAQHPLDDLLIYRTFLFAMLFELAVDISDLVENQDCNRIIPIF